MLREIDRTNLDVGRRLRAIWALHASGGLDDPAYRALLDDPSEHVRASGRSATRRSRHTGARSARSFRRAGPFGPEPEGAAEPGVGAESVAARQSVGTRLNRSPATGKMPPTACFRSWCGTVSSRWLPPISSGGGGMGGPVHDSAFAAERGTVGGRGRCGGRPGGPGRGPPSRRARPTAQISDRYP